MKSWLCLIGLHRMKWGTTYEWRGKTTLHNHWTGNLMGPIDISETRQPGTCERCGLARERQVSA